jgi:hypothetical protein
MTMRKKKSASVFLFPFSFSFFFTTYPLQTLLPLRIFGTIFRIKWVSREKKGCINGIQTTMGRRERSLNTHAMGFFLFLVSLLLLALWILIVSSEWFFFMTWLGSSSGKYDITFWMLMNGGRGNQKKKKSCLCVCVNEQLLHMKRN